jgi:hypothetical protein
VECLDALLDLNSAQLERLVTHQLGLRVSGLKDPTGQRFRRVTPELVLIQGDPLHSLLGPVVRPLVDTIWNEDARSQDRLRRTDDL